MAQKSGFFNAMLSNGTYDRKYNAEDYCDNLAVIIGNGVLRSNNDDLKVTAAGMVVTVGAGRAWINGHFYRNDAPFSFSAVSAPIGGTRYDRVFLRLNKNISARSVSLVYQQGTASNAPVKPAPTRTDTIFDLVLADIYVGTNATSVTVTDTRADASVCGWVYSTSGDGSFFTTLDNDFDTWFEDKKDTLASVTLFKRYEWATTLTEPGSIVQFNIPQYDPETGFVDVYVNGILDNEYTLDGSKITFDGTLVAGTEITVRAYKSIDGTGIMTVADEITELQNQVAALDSESDYVYHCNGTSDNVQLSNIAAAWLNGGTGCDSKIVRVYGTFGASAPVAGSGTSASPYRWFIIGNDASTNRRIVFDFSGCSAITLPVTAGAYNTVFYGADAYIIGANVIANQSAAGTVVKMFSSASGDVNVKNCRFWVTAYKDSMIASNGTFENCRGSIANVSTASYCFLPFSTGLLRLIGGEYYAYTGGSTLRSAVVGQSATDAVSILYGVNAPSSARTGFYQTDAIIQYVGGGLMSCTDLVSPLAVTVTAGISNIRGTLAKNKPGQM